MSNKKGKEVAFTNHPTKQRSKRLSQIISLFSTSQIASSPLVEGVQSTYSHPPPMDERLNLGSNESDSTSNETCLHQSQMTMMSSQY